MNKINITDQTDNQTVSKIEIEIKSGNNKKSIRSYLTKICKMIIDSKEEFSIQMVSYGN